MTRGARAALAALAAFALACGLAVPREPSAEPELPFTEEEAAGIRTIIRDYLLENPEILDEARRILDDRAALAARDKAKTLIARNRDRLFRDDHSFVAGNPDGDVTIVEFFDYRCPYCKGWMPKLDRLVEEDPDLRIVYKEYPILGPESVIASRAAIASLRQDGYGEFHKALLSARGTLTEEKIFAIAADQGLDVARLRREMDDPEIDATLEANKKLADDLELLGTPTFIVGDGFFEPWLSVEDLQATIAEIRNP